MFLNIMTKIPGYPEDRMVVDLQAPGFPSLLILDCTGKVIRKNVPRTVAGMRRAMAELPAPKSANVAEEDRASVAMEFLRRAKMKKIEPGGGDRAVYLSCRSFLNPKQRRMIDRTFAEFELQAAREAAAMAAADSPARTRAAIAVHCARAKLADRSAADASEKPLPGLAETLAAVDVHLRKHAPGTIEHDNCIITVLECRGQKSWVREAGAPRALVALMNRAEGEGDPHLFSVWLAEWRVATGGGKPAVQAEYLEARLARLWSGLPPLRRAVPR